MLEHSKAASVIAVSALERRMRIFDGEHVSREPEMISSPSDSLLSQVLCVIFLKRKIRDCGTGRRSDPLSRS